MAKIGVVIVTFNRLEKLKIALEKFAEQTLQPEYVLVVNNASTDGTYEYLESWAQQNNGYRQLVYNCDENTGGSGGFATALERAVVLDADWIWISDDDAFPEKETVHDVSEYIENHPEQSIAALCTTVLNNNTIDEAHRRRVKKGVFRIVEKYVDHDEYKEPFFFLDEFSYVGVVIKKEILNKVGLTKAEFFINQDDTEHSLRISKVGNIVCVPSIRVHHNTGKVTGKEVTWKRYYEIRNKYYTYQSNFAPRYCRYYYLSTYLKYSIKKLFKLRSKDELEMYRCALHDIRHNITGKHTIFKPGWVYKD